MATEPPKKPKRTPIVLNMHLLDKKEDKDEKIAKDSKEEKKPAEPIQKNEDKGKSTTSNVKTDESKNEDQTNKTKAEEPPFSGPRDNKNNMNKNEGMREERQRGVCRDFVRNICARGDNCRFFHPTSGVATPDRRRSSWLVLCHDYQNGLCMRSDCRYFHIAREDENLYHTTGEIHPRVVEQVLRKALYIDMFSPGVRPSCKEFLKGNCNLPTCRFRHLDRREHEEEIFRSLQEEFQVVFGPTDTRGMSPHRQTYQSHLYQSPAWYDRPTYDTPESLPPGDLRTTVLGSGGGMEPEFKRRRHYSDERSYQYPNDYRLSDMQRPWDDRFDYDRRPLPSSSHPAEIDRMMQEISNLRADKIEITRSMDQQILNLRDELAILTRENENLHQDNGYLRNSMVDVEGSNKAAVDSLMMTNDNLVEDNKQLKIALKTAEGEATEGKKLLGKKIDELEKEKKELINNFNLAKDSEKKLKDEIQKMKNEKETLQKIRDNLKAELERANHQLTLNTASQNSVRKDEVKDNKNINQQNDTSSSRRQRAAARDLNKPDISPWANNTGNQMKNDWQDRSWTDAQRNNDRRNDFPEKNSTFKQEGPWKSGAAEKSVPTQPQSLLGEFPQTSSLLGQYPPSVGKEVIQALSEFGANKSQLSQPPPKITPSKVDEPQGNMGLNVNPEGARAGFGAMSGRNGQRPDYVANQGQGVPHSLPDQRSDYGLNQRSDFGGQRSDYRMGQRSDFRSNYGPDQRSDFGQSQSLGGRSDFRPTQGPGGRSDFGPTQGPGGRSDFGSAQGPGSRSDFGSAQGPGGRSDFGSAQGPAGRSDFGSNQGTGGRSDFGLNQGPGGRSDFATNQGPGARSDYGAIQGSGGRSDFGASQGPGGRSDYGANQGPGGRSDFGSSQGPAGRSDFGPSQGPGGRSDFGSTPSRSGPWESGVPPTKAQLDQSSDYGANRSQSGQWGDYGSSRGQGGPRGDAWSSRSEGQSRGSLWESEKEPFGSSYNMGPSRSRMGDRDYGLSGYDNGIRDSGFGAGADMRNSSSGSLRGGNWLKDDDRLSAGRSRAGYQY